MSGGMKHNWRTPTVGIMGSAGMQNPSDHSTVEKTTSEDLVNSVVQEKIVYQDRNVYVVSEQMHDTLMEIGKRLDEVEGRQYDLKKSLDGGFERIASMLEHRDSVMEEYRNFVASKLDEMDINLRSLELRVLQLESSPKVTLWGLIKDLWAAD
jgi:hypothetical protein